MKWPQLHLRVKSKGSMEFKKDLDASTQFQEGRDSIRKHAETKGAPRKRRPVYFQDRYRIIYGVRSRKNRCGSDTLIGNEFENVPLALYTPVVFVVQVDTGAATFVEVSQVNPAPGRPPLPVRMRLPPEMVEGLTTG